MSLTKLSLGGNNLIIPAQGEFFKVTPRLGTDKINNLSYSVGSSFFLLVIVSHQWCDLFHRLLHSYTRHIERESRGERDIVPSTQDGGHAYVA